VTLWSWHLAGDLRVEGSNSGRSRTPTGTTLGCLKMHKKIKMISSQDFKVSEMINFTRHSRKKIKVIALEIVRIAMALFRLG